MRWSALDVDYEMAGKDLIASVALSSRICRVLGAAPPVTYIYELFLDQNGEKISKSKGNGLSLDEWLRYAPAESLAYFMYQKPRTAKRLFFGVIPKPSMTISPAWLPTPRRIRRRGSIIRSGMSMRAIRRKTRTCPATA